MSIGARAVGALERVGPAWAAERHPRDLSSGERERLGLAALAVAEPDLLVLDEPTRGIDPDRKAEIGEWLAEHSDSGGVMSCSALKRQYRDQLRKHCASLQFLHLSGSPEVIAARQASRPGHFMPPSLLASQFATLEPLGAAEAGVAIGVDQDIDAIVAAYVAQTQEM